MTLASKLIGLLSSLNHLDATDVNCAVLVDPSDTLNYNEKEAMKGA